MPQVKHVPSIGQLKAHAVFDSLGSTPQPDVAQEVALLRQELSKLSEALLPRTGAILTGRAVTDEFNNLTQRK